MRLLCAVIAFAPFLAYVDAQYPAPASPALDAPFSGWSAVAISALVFGGAFALLILMCLCSYFLCYTPSEIVDNRQYGAEDSAAQEGIAQSFTWTISKGSLAAKGSTDRLDRNASSLFIERER